MFSMTFVCVVFMVVMMVVSPAFGFVPLCQPGKYYDGSLSDPTVNPIDHCNTCCADCAPGTYTSQLNVNPSCTICPANTFSEASSSSCKCNPGSFRAVEEATDDYSYASVDYEVTYACTLCPPGTYANTAAAEECLPCPKGTTSQKGAIICLTSENVFLRH